MFLDVGQGDCILIHEPLLGKTILIDVAGSLYRDTAEEIIYPVLKSKGITTLDYVIITHDDYDHMGGLSRLHELIDIDEVISDIDKLELDKIDLYNLNQIEHHDKNEDSIVLFGSIYGLNYLFTGDAGIIVEDEILDSYNKLKVDVLKVSHHGSNTGSSAKFIQAINPRIAIISSGYNNYYGHPHEEVLEIFKNQQVKVFNTQIHGSVSIYFSSYLHFLRTGSKEFGIMK